MPQPRSDLDASFAAVYRAQFAFVWRTVRALGAPPAHIEDLVQEVFLAARAKFGGFDARRSVRAWLFGIARNEVLQFRRTTARYRRRVERLEPKPPGPLPDEVAAMKEAAALVDAFLGRLDEAHRLSFVSAVLEELPGPEIAAALGIPLQTHYARVRAARRRLAAFTDGLATAADRDGTDG